LTTSNKNFKVKNGLEVLGTSATVDGNDVLTTASNIEDLANVDITGAVEGNALVFDSSLNLVPGEGSGGESGSQHFISDTKPLEANEGDTWFHSTTGATYIYYVDVDSEQWIQMGEGLVGPVGPQGLIGPIGDTGEPGIAIQPEEPEATDVLWFDTSVDGEGIPVGGTAGQALAKIDSTDFNTEWVDVVSQSSLDLALEDYYTSAQIDTSLQDYYTISQTDSAISTAVSNVVDTAPEMLDTLNELSAALNDDPNFASTVADALAALVPSGTINQTARATAPTGYLLCDGSAISRTTYSNLFDAIGTAYGAGDGSTTFNIPNLKGRVPVGYDPSQSEFDALGETGGAKTHTISATELPSHTHSGTTNGQSNDHSHGFSATTSTGGAHTHDIYGSNGGSAGVSISVTSNTNNDRSWYLAGGLAGSAGSHNHTVSGNTGGTSSNHTHSFTTDGGTGSGAAHNNLQPYVVLNYMIKI
jgi:microcystin-dependent protein